MWVERPARLFQGLLAETLRAKSGRLVFEAGDTDAKGAVRLSGRLVEMGYDARSRAVVVRFDALRDAGGALSTRRFEAVEPGVLPDAASVGPAINRAANKVAAEVADWVGK
jgi:cholesterol transport system auxiliary component